MRLSRGSRAFLKPYGALTSSWRVRVREPRGTKCRSASPSAEPRQGYDPAAWRPPERYPTWQAASGSAARSRSMTLHCWWDVWPSVSPRHYRLNEGGIIHNLGPKLTTSLRESGPGTANLTQTQPKLPVLGRGSAAGARPDGRTKVAHCYSEAWAGGEAGAKVKTTTTQTDPNPLEVPDAPHRPVATHAPGSEKFPGESGFSAAGALRPTFGLRLQIGEPRLEIPADEPVHVEKQPGQFGHIGTGAVQRPDHFRGAIPGQQLEGGDIVAGNRLDEIQIDPDGARCERLRDPHPPLPGLAVALPLINGTRTLSGAAVGTFHGRVELLP